MKLYDVREVTDAEQKAGDLFFNAFRCKIPTDPHHFVLEVKTHEGIETCGYVHYQKYKYRQFLCGGLVINAKIFKKLSPELRMLVKSNGGFAEILLKSSFNKLKPWDIIWGYVGDKLAEKVDLRVGFKHTHRKYIMAVWGKNYSEVDKYALVEEIHKIGPF